MKKSHEFFFHEAMIESEKSLHTKFKHGSVVVHRNTIVGKGFNSGWTHAEMSSIHNKKTIKGGIGCKLTVFVVRRSFAGEFRNSKPCEKCQQFMKRSGISRAYYSTGIDTNRFESMKIN